MDVGRGYRLLRIGLCECRVIVWVRGKYVLSYHIEMCQLQGSWYGCAYLMDPCCL
jgi:hypothetical protein